ncbi:MAG TPA: helix-turn-helix domain-containing protein [Thermomicrobiales bacterium]|nr:helix-turn-helix domain-containing protein [Thermomicrobiales bacterium]
MNEDFTPDEQAEARRYTLVLRWSDEDQAWLVTAPELLSRTITHGRTVEEAIAQGEDAVASVLFAMPDYAAQRPPRADVTGGRYVVAKAPHFDAEGVRAIRKQLDLSQEAFAELLNVSRGAVRAWEQGQRSPDGAARRLLEIVARQPFAALRPLA